MRRLALIFVILFFAPLCWGQSYTTVSSTVVDSAGTPYTFGTYTASLVNTTNQTPTFGGNSVFQKTFQGGLDTNGLFSLSLPSVTAMFPTSGLQWSFLVCANPKAIADVFPAPLLPCFTYTSTGTQISGSSVDLSASMTAVAAIIPRLIVSTANNTFTGATTFTGPKPSISVNSENVGTTNAVRWVGTAPMFTTVEAAQTDCLNDATIKGCIIWITSGFRETFTSTITIGSATQTVVLWLQPDSQLTCNVTGGVDCFDISPGSGIVGHNVGSLGTPTRTSGAVLYAAATANFGSMIKPTTCATSGGSSYVTLNNLWIEAAVGAVGTTLVDVCSYNNFPDIANLFITPVANSIGVKIHASTASGAFTGPIYLTNIFVECLGRAGCRPAQILSDSGTNSVNEIVWEGGYINHPGTGLPNLEINGNGNSNKAVQGIRVHVYMEELLNNSSPIIKIVDALNVDLTGTVIQGSDTDTCVDISQTGAGKTGGIHWSVLGCRSSGGLITTVNNHISGLTQPGGNQSSPFYNFGGDTTFIPLPFTVDTNAMESNGSMKLGAISAPNARLHITSSAALLNGIQIDDTEASGKNIYFGPGVKVVGRFSVVDSSDSNVEMIGCTLQAAVGCFVTGGLAPFTAGSGDLGTTALPFGNLWLGTAATNNFKFQPAATAAARVISILDPGAATTLDLTSNTSTTTTQVLHASATAGVGTYSGIATADIATALTTPGPIGGTTPSTGKFTSMTATNLLWSTTAPTIAGAGCGGSGATISANNGTAAFSIGTGTTPTSACTVTMPAATTGWVCEANTVSATSTTNFVVKQTGAVSTTSVVLTLFTDVAATQSYTASDTIRVKCSAY